MADESQSQVVVSPEQPAAQPVSAPAASFEPAPEPTQQPASPDDPNAISWTASEFIAHDKSAGWYLALLALTALVAGGVYWLTRDYISVAVVFFAAIVFAYFAAHKPRQLEYRLTTGGLDIDGKHYNIGSFRTFSVIPEGAFSSIVLMPLKRFAPPLSIYFAPDDEERIINLLQSVLPFEERRRDVVDSLMHRIRF